MRPHGPHPHRHHRRPPIGWILARGIHRTVVMFLLLALALGAFAGWMLAAGNTGSYCLAAALLFAIWPLAWMASWRIAWPLRELAKVAEQIRGGRLASREELPGGPGEVGQVADALGVVTDRVARQLRDQRALLAAVSHELRSPLGRARVMIELAREGHTEVYDQLQGEIDAMDGLVGDLLAAARIDFEAVSPVPIPAAELATRAVEVAGVGEVDADDASVRADPTLMGRALAAMLDNARRYGGSTIQLRVRGRATRVRFEVVDDGPGFGPGGAEQAFAPFWRGQGAAPGVGLGLALVRQIAEAHGGEAGADNRPEGGAVVWIELPRE